MFVQVIEGRVSDAGALRRRFEAWERDLRPGATGFVGSTAGVADDGRAFALARFESAEAARANSDRPEQSAWWEETAKCFDGEVTFSESEDVDSLLAGGANDAGFVQIMKGSHADREKIREGDAVFEEFAPTFRPDVIGGQRVWTSPDSYVEAVYFTSEEAAREGEHKEPPAELRSRIGDFESLMAGVEFIDLRDLWLA